MQPDTAVCPKCNSRLKPLNQRPAPAAEELAQKEKLVERAPETPVDTNLSVPAPNTSSDWGTSSSAAAGSRSMMAVGGMVIAFVLIAAIVGMQTLTPLVNKAKVVTVRARMERLKQSAEAVYAQNHTFPRDTNQFTQSFLESPMDNPVTHKDILRVNAPADMAVVTKEVCNLSPWEIEYSPILSGGQVTSYVIRGADGTGQFIKNDDGSVFILTH